MISTTEGLAKTYHRFVNTTPNPRATKNSSGELDGPLPLPGGALGDADAAALEEGRCEEAEEEEREVVCRVEATEEVTEWRVEARVEVTREEAVEDMATGGGGEGGLCPYSMQAR